MQKATEEKYKTWKYGGEAFYEPWWFPENQQRKMRFQVLKKGLDGAVSHFAENENYSNEGAKDMLNTVLDLLKIMIAVNPDYKVSEAIRYMEQSLAETEEDATIK